MENNKPKDQNPEKAVTPEENTPIADEAKVEDGKQENKEPVKTETVAPAEGEVQQEKEPAAAPEEKEETEEAGKEEKDTARKKKEASEEEKAAPEEEVAAQEEEDTSQEEQATALAEDGKEKEAPTDEDGKKKEKEAPSDEDEDEDAIDEEEEEEEEEEKFEEYSGEELVARLEELVENEDVNTIKTKVALIKVSFIRIMKQEQQKALDDFLKEGGKEEEFKLEENKLQKRFNAAFDRYRKNKVKFNEQLEEQKLENLDKKNEILEKLKALIASEETLKKTYDEFRSLQTEWKEVGMVPSGEVSNLWQSYHFLVEKFFDKVKINKELRDLDMKKNLEMKIELCEKAEELLLETSIIKSFKELQKLHDEWKEIGPVPQEQNDEIWERFKAATDKINDRRREHYGQLQEEQQQNLLAKTGLCEQAEELLAVNPKNMKEWQENTNKMNELFSVWRTIGRAPKKENNAIWDRFKGSMNAFFANRKEFLNTIKDEQLNNYNLKVDICVEAESLKDSEDWKSTTQELIRLQKDWKKIGPVPRKHSDKIWKRFRAACDEFFDRKANHFAGVHENEQQNLEKKKELIQQVNEQKFSEDKSKNLDILKDFQRKWMAIGFVPMKEKDKVQKEFRAAVDARLDELKISSTELSNASYATRMEAVKDSPDAGRVYRKEISFLNNKISKLKDDVILWENNLGFFANSKKADILKKEFEGKIDKAKQELAAMEAKVKYLRKMSAEQ